MVESIGIATELYIFCFDRWRHRSTRVQEYSKSDNLLLIECLEQTVS